MPDAAQAFMEKLPNFDLSWPDDMRERWLGCATRILKMNDKTYVHATWEGVAAGIARDCQSLADAVAKAEGRPSPPNMEWWLTHEISKALLSAASTLPADAAPSGQAE